MNGKDRGIKDRGPVFNKAPHVFISDYDKNKGCKGGVKLSNEIYDELEDTLLSLPGQDERKSEIFIDDDLATSLKNNNINIISDEECER